MLHKGRTLSASHSHLLTFATLGASAAPFIFTAATEGTGNSRFALGILEFPKIRHCEALKKEGAISFIKP
ncbi:MAG: hypothetical protein SO039_02710 [Campylobacter sp.]|nr:hypothetical protein [Campylobacter sp.]